MFFNYFRCGVPTCFLCLHRKGTRIRTYFWTYFTRVDKVYYTKVQQRYTYIWVTSYTRTLPNVRIHCSTRNACIMIWRRRNTPRWYYRKDTMYLNACDICYYTRVIYSNISTGDVAFYVKITKTIHANCALHVCITVDMHKLCLVRNSFSKNY